MLKITVTDAGSQRTLALEGKLVDPWVDELEKTWDEALHSGDSRSLLVDLRDVTAISLRGEDLLCRMMTAGAQLHCCRGVLTKHVLQQIVQRQDAVCGKGKS